MKRSMNFKKFKSKFLLILLVLNTFLIFNKGFIKSSSAGYNLNPTLDRTKMKPGEKVKLSWTTPDVIGSYDMAYIEIYKNGKEYQYVARVDGHGYKEIWIQMNTEGVYQFKIRTVTSSSSGTYTTKREFTYNIAVGEYDVNVKIIYDISAWSHLTWTFRTPEILVFSVYTALNEGFGQYFNINFNTKYEVDWCDYDSNGYNGKDMTDMKNWGINYNISSKFHIAIFFTYKPSLDVGVQGMAYGSNFVILNLAYIYQQLTWNLGINGILSVIMHEVGHIYGITGEGNADRGGTDLEGEIDSTGDTTDKRPSVMDYWLARFGSGKIFDGGHVSTIATKLATYSN